jgi:hypothetical protein
VFGQKKGNQKGLGGAKGRKLEDETHDKEHDTACCIIYFYINE